MLSPVPPDAEPLTAYVAHFRARVLQDALLEATEAYWLRRAAAFAGAASRPGDYPGQATPEQLAARDERTRGIAQACRNRAAVGLSDVPMEDIYPMILGAA